MREIVCKNQSTVYRYRFNTVPFYIDSPPVCSAVSFDTRLYKR
jgi:hypothetical protein